jgi:uncharacterized protein (DUF1800 family)
MSRSNRRTFLLSGALASLGAMLPRRAAAQRTSARQRTAGPARVPELAALAPQSWQSNVVRLARRATLGTTAAEAARVRQLGYQAYLTEQLNYTRLDDTAIDTYVAGRWPSLLKGPNEIYTENAGTLLNQLSEATLYRAAFSKRQLFERMVEFWTDHFSINMRDVGYLKVIDDRDVIRKHALGKFPDLLRASTRSAAMLAYLDQNLSRVGRPNQNYARELMELHTLGVDGGYSQEDVAELSRVLTGWTIRGRGDFNFDPALHDWGSKQVLGVTIPSGSPSMGADGIKEGERIIQVLIDHPSTARFISKKMLQWLLTPEPTAAQVSTIASVYKATGGDIKAMVRAILNEAWLGAAPAKFKRPYHYLVSAVRGTGAAVSITSSLYTRANALGHPLFTWETPDGFPDKMEYWVGNILTRWSFASSLTTGTSGATVDLSRFQPGTPAGTVDAIDVAMFGGEMPGETRTMLVTYLAGGAYSVDRVRETLALAMSSAAFQWY